MAGQSGKKDDSAGIEMRRGLSKSMNENQKNLNSDAGENKEVVSPSGALDPLETPNRRELIERYGKYAIVAAPLLLFATKARAIHSAP